MKNKTICKEDVFKRCLERTSVNSKCEAAECALQSPEINFAMQIITRPHKEVPTWPWHPWLFIPCSTATARTNKAPWLTMRTTMDTKQQMRSMRTLLHNLECP